MSQALYRKYRPKGWDEVVGQDHVVQTLKNAILTDRVGHAYLFAGPRGTGKTTLARILAKAVNCLDANRAARPCNACEHCRAVNENRYLDLIEMDAASNTGVEDVRELRDRIGFSPSQGNFKVYIIDEVHMLSTPAFNALLKTLEEPPPHAIFVLATTEIHKIPATVLSRCQRHEFRRVPVAEIASNLRNIVSNEGWQADEEALLLIARQATGSVRDAQSLLDQLASMSTKITLELVLPVLGTATSQAVLDLLDAIQAGKPASGLETLRKTLDSGVDPRTLARQILEYLRDLMLIQMGNAAQVEAPKDIRERMNQHAAAISAPRVIKMMRAFNAAAADTRGGWQPSLGLELALAESFDVNPPAGNVHREAPAGPAAGGRGGPLVANSEDRPPRQSRTAAGAARTGGQESKTASEAPGRGPTPLEVQSEQGTGAANGVEPARALPAAGMDLTEIAKHWKDIRAALKHAHPNVDALLNSCKPVEIRGNDLLLGFQSETVRAMMDRPENMEAARQAIMTVLGQDLQLRCVVINSRGKVPPNIPEDGMVATALNHGGEIVDMQE